MATRKRKPKASGTITLSDKGEIRKVCDALLGVLWSLKYSEQDQFAIHLAADEAITNAIIHGNKEDPKKSVRVDYEVFTDKVIIKITDEGEGFDFRRLEDCTEPKHLLENHGRGVCLMRKFMDELSFADKGNSVRMVRFCGSKKGREENK
jgi:serine/threonine-protein kinase RsbW